MNAKRSKKFLLPSLTSGIVAAFLILTSPAFRAQDKDTLWTLVKAQDNSIVVNWDKSHPWDQQLSAPQGADLVAEYQSGKVWCNCPGSREQP
jgi:hypothetical protein